jgi:hypothetical protein
MLRYSGTLITLTDVMCSGRLKDKTNVSHSCALLYHHTDNV